LFQYHGINSYAGQGAIFFELFYFDICLHVENRSFYSIDHLQFDKSGLTDSCVKFSRFFELSLFSYGYRPRHSAEENGCDYLTVEGLHENWTLAPMNAEDFITPDNFQKKSYFHIKLQSLG
jgi:hypothetical protein